MTGHRSATRQGPRAEAPGRHPLSMLVRSFGQGTLTEAGRKVVRDVPSLVTDFNRLAAQPPKLLPLVSACTFDGRRRVASNGRLWAR